MNYFYETNEAEFQRFVQKAKVEHKNRAMLLAAVATGQLPFLEPLLLNEGFTRLIEGNNSQYNYDRTRITEQNNIVLFGFQVNAPKELSPEVVAAEMTKFGSRWLGKKPTKAVITRAFGRGD